MKARFRFRISLVAVAVVALLAAMAHAVLHIGYGIALAFGLAGIVLNGIVTGIDDHRRRGLENPQDDPPAEDP